MNRTWSELREILGGHLGETSKMPGFSFGLPAKKSCPVGSTLLGVPGSTCSGCYGMRGHYLFPVVKDCQDRRLAVAQAAVANTKAGNEWVDAMVEAIYKPKKVIPWFRWLDTGDIFSRGFLDLIFSVARRTGQDREPGKKEILHWIPTQQRLFVRDCTPPANVCIRVSDTMIGFDDPPPRNPHIHQSGVRLDGDHMSGFLCPASKQGNKCLDCRACWDRKVQKVLYKKH